MISANQVHLLISQERTAFEAADMSEQIIPSLSLLSPLKSVLRFQDRLRLKASARHSLISKASRNNSCSVLEEAGIAKHSQRKKQGGETPVTFSAKRRDSNDV